MMTRDKDKMTGAQIAGAFFVFAGVILVASDGPYFPWPNVVGLLILTLITCMMSEKT